MNINYTYGICAGALSAIAVLWQAYASWRKGFLKSFLHHGGMWGDFFIVTPTLAWIAAVCASLWLVHQWVEALTISATLTAFMGWAWAKDPTPSSHTAHGRQTEAGWVHLVYMVPSIALVLLFYLCTPAEASIRAVWIITSLLVFHIFCGTHMTLGILIKLGLVEGEASNKRYLEDKGAWATFIVVSCVLIGRSVAITVER